MVGAAARVDVCVVSWNTRDLTVRALREVAAGAGRLELRLLVRDNGSSDGTAAAVRSAVATAEVDAGADNLGFAAGVNSAIRRGDAPWILLLNSDAWPEPGAIEALIDCAQRHPAAALVVPRLLRPDGSLEHSTWPFPSLPVAARSAVSPQHYMGGHDTERRVDWAVGAAWLLRRSAVDDVGGLDESLFMYAEDLEWCWRAADRGYEVWLAPDAVVRHVGNASGSARYGERRAVVWIGNTIRVYRRRHGTAGTALWRSLNAAGALRAAWRFRRQHQRELSRHWRLQARTWIGRGPAAVFPDDPAQEPGRR